MVNRNPGYIRCFVPFLRGDAALGQNAALRQEQLQLINDLRLPVPVIFTRTRTHNGLAFPIGFNLRDRTVQRLGHDFRPATLIKSMLLGARSRDYTHLSASSMGRYTVPTLPS